MSTVDEQHVKSRNPEKFTILDRESFQDIPQIRVKFCQGSIQV